MLKSPSLVEEDRTDYEKFLFIVSQDKRVEIAFSSFKERLRVCGYDKEMAKKIYYETSRRLKCLEIMWKKKIANQQIQKMIERLSQKCNILTHSIKKEDNIHFEGSVNLGAVIDDFLTAIERRYSISPQETQLVRQRLKEINVKVKETDSLSESQKENAIEAISQCFALHKKNKSSFLAKADFELKAYVAAPSAFSQPGMIIFSEIILMAREIDALRKKVSQKEISDALDAVANAQTVSTRMLEAVYPFFDEIYAKNSHMESLLSDYDALYQRSYPSLKIPAFLKAQPVKFPPLKEPSTDFFSANIFLAEEDVVELFSHVPRGRSTEKFSTTTLQECFSSLDMGKGVSSHYLPLYAQGLNGQNSSAQEDEVHQKDPKMKKKTNKPSFWRE